MNKKQTVLRLTRAALAPLCLRNLMLFGAVFFIARGAWLFDPIIGRLVLGWLLLEGARRFK